MMKKFPLLILLSLILVTSLQGMPTEEISDKTTESMKAEEEAANRYAQMQTAEALRMQYKTLDNNEIITGWPINPEVDNSPPAKQETSDLKDPKELSKDELLNATILTKKPILEVETGSHASQAERLGPKSGQSLPYTNFGTPQGVEIASMFLKDPKKIKKSYENEYKKRLLQEEGKLDQQEFENLNKELRALYATKIDCLEQAAQSETPIKEEWIQAAEKIDLAIKSRLLYAEQIKKRSLKEAKKTRTAGEILFCEAQRFRATALEKTYKLKDAQDRAEGKKEIISDLLGIAYVASVAVSCFTEAVKEGISKEERSAWMEAGLYRLEIVQALAARKPLENLYNLAKAKSSEASCFAKAAQEGISEEERSAWMQAGSYKLEEAKAWAAREEERARNLERAADAKSSEASCFAKAAQEGISEEERSAWMQAGSYKLEEAKAWAAREEKQANNLRRAADAKSSAAFCLAKAAKEGISEEERKAYLQAGVYSSDEAEAWATGDLDQAGYFKEAYSATVQAAHCFRDASFFNNNQSKGSYQLKLGQLWASGQRKMAEDFSYERYLEEESFKANQELNTLNSGRVWKGLP